MAARPTWTDDEVRKLLTAGEAIESWTRDRRERRWEDLGLLAQLVACLTTEFRGALGAFTRSSPRLPVGKHRRRRDRLKRLVDATCELKAQWHRRWMYAEYGPPGRQREEVATTDIDAAVTPPSAPPSNVVDLMTCLKASRDRPRRRRGRNDRPHITIQHGADT